MKRMYLQESTTTKIPRNLELLISSISEKRTETLDNETSSENKENLRNDYIVVLLYVLMLETGYTPLNTALLEVQEDENKPSFQDFNSCRSLPLKWRRKDGSVYSMSFLLIPFVQEYQCHFIITPSGEYIIASLIVDSYVKNIINARSICIRTSDYVVNPTADNMPQKFNNLSELSIKFKNQVAAPIRCAILTNEGVLNASLQGIPNEAKLKILKSLNVKDLVNVLQTCKELYHLGSAPCVWRYMLKRDFKSYSEGDPLILQNMWKNAYIDRYRTKTKRNKRFTRLESVEGQFDLPTLDSLVFPVEETKDTMPQII